MLLEEINMALFKLLIFNTLFVLNFAARKKNVIVMISDDLRPQLNSYSGEDFPSSVSPRMYTPNTDELANNSIVFKRAYCQYPICGPSRTSFLTSRRPHTSKVYRNTEYWRDMSGNFTTLPQYFKEQGYYTVGMGKIFHTSSSGQQDKAYSWSEKVWSSTTFKNKWKATWSDRSWRSLDSSTETATPIRDQEIADYAVKTIGRLKYNAINDIQPFLMMVGFHLPHLPFVFPERFLEDYPVSDVNLAPRIYAPVNMPTVAHNRGQELTGYADVGALGYRGAVNETIDTSKALELRRAYYAAVSYVDSLVGQVLDAVRSNGLSDDTIVVLLSDHGWQLGDLGIWTKGTNFEFSNHVPLMIKVPGVTDGGISSRNLVELTDLMPTLVELAGLTTVPPCVQSTAGSDKLCTEGSSLVPLINNSSSSNWKDAAFFQVLRVQPRQAYPVMGYSIRTDEYRYTKWLKYDSNSNSADWSTVAARELYRYTSTDKEEDINIVDDTDVNLVASLDSRLQQAFAVTGSVQGRAVSFGDTTPAPQLSKTRTARSNGDGTGMRRANGKSLTAPTRGQGFTRTPRFTRKAKSRGRDFTRKAKGWRFTRKAKALTRQAVGQGFTSKPIQITTVQGFTRSPGNRGYPTRAKGQGITVSPRGQRFTRKAKGQRFTRIPTGPWYPRNSRGFGRPNAKGKNHRTFGR